MKANFLLKQNIDALLTVRRLTRKDLAFACKRTEAWLSKIFTNEKREVPMKYLDVIAATLNVSAYQLFQPGIARTTERRSGKDRRSGMERRISSAQRTMLALDSTVANVHPRRLEEAQRVFSASEIAIIDQLRTMPDALSDVTQLLGLKTKIQKRRSAKIVSKKVKKPA